jgi:hypothetical protein
MNRWQHNICHSCWEERAPGRIPYRTVRIKEERCCFCGATNQDAIYVRERPDHPELLCKGEHAE